MSRPERAGNKGAGEYALRRGLGILPLSCWIVICQPGEEITVPQKRTSREGAKGRRRLTQRRGDAEGREEIQQLPRQQNTTRYPGEKLFKNIPESV